MKRQLTSILLFSALLVGGASTFVSCTDHESDSAYNTSISLADAIKQQANALDDLTRDMENKLSTKLDKNDPDYLALDGRINANKQVLDAWKNSPVNELAGYATLDAAIRASQAYTDLDGKYDDLLVKIQGEDGKGGLVGEIEALRQKQSEDATALTTLLNEKFSSLSGTVTSLKEAQAKVNQAYADALEYLVNKNLSNIAINATENPVLGYYNAAFLGSQLNLASSFYGTAAQTNQDWHIAQGDFLNEGNAGYIYVSLNPTEFSPSNIVDLKLVDSQGNEAKGFELGKIENTDKVLTYGVRATTSSNGFYAIPVNAVDPANDDFSLNKGELKEAAKNIIAKLQNPKESNLNLSQIATALYNSVNNKLKAYTVKAEYYLYDSSKPEGERLVKKHQVAPTYNMAAFAVNPLSYNTLKDNQSLKNLGLALDKYMLPTLSDKLGKFMDALDFQIKNEDGKQIKAYTMLTSNTVNCYEVPNENGTTDVIIRDQYGNEQRLPNTKLATTLYGVYENWEVYTKVPDQYGGWYWERLDHEVDIYERIYVFETTDNTIDELIGSINDQIGTQLQPVKDAITNAATKWDNAITSVNNLLHKINAHISDVNQLLQPTMLYKSSKTGDWNTLSTLGGRLGTRMTGTGSTVLVATSWTGELLAPAYKKTVEVKGNPAGATVTLMDGTTPAKKIAGSTQKVLFTATAKGDYTIVYKAVDYSGVSVEKEYHITVE
ncbi:hypothetical protein ONT16_09225 [Prevotella copri]|uniref:Lipoprotein n=1 Tax=Segatella copri TaxID=165179 RepID=A0AAP3BD39_9BACT|nr:hypothetical protein [Segatella copri]MCW4128433.1 hypothetical protein [Segatella copri]MCW4415944.1 hypothetical protein [Segatella copri]MCW4421198.1 hypothetical protein [Segatella copri]